MTEQNQKKLYEHFLKTGQVDRAEELLKAYPHFAVAEQPKSKKEK